MKGFSKTAPPRDITFDTLRSHHVEPFLPLYLSFSSTYMAIASQETPSKRARYVTYHDQGWGYKKIAEKVNTSIKRMRV